MLKISQLVLVVSAITILSVGCDKAQNKVVDAPSAAQTPTAEEVQALNAQMDDAMSSSE